MEFVPLLVVLIIGVFIGVCATIAFALIRFPWLRPFDPLCPQGIKGVRPLEVLITQLGKVDLWLDAEKMQITRDMHSMLWQQVSFLHAEIHVRRAIFAHSRNTRLWAFRQLSQMQESVALEAIRRIANHPDVDEKIRIDARDIRAKSGGRQSKPANSPEMNGTQGSDEHNSESTGRESSIHVNVTVGDNYMNSEKDKYVNYGNVGNMGPSGSIDTLNFNQIWNDNYVSQINLVNLAEELKNLGHSMEQLPDASDHQLAISAVRDAEVAARNGNGPRVLSFLTKVGQWGLDFATKVGSTVVAEVIKKSLGY